jgi:hypothetical protein
MKKKTHGAAPALARPKKSRPGRAAGKPAVVQATVAVVAEPAPASAPPKRSALATRVTIALKRHQKAPFGPRGIAILEQWQRELAEEAASA